ncbi:hypothetical protein ACTJK5_09615 [Agrobacterium sp. 22094]|uniref:hypothetical protein n=1 Tax=Agrobacterium sp. 22094 TaxID=3453872 RepID=UPI003F85DF09
MVVAGGAQRKPPAVGAAGGGWDRYARSSNSTSNLLKLCVDFLGDCERAVLPVNVNVEANALLPVDGSNFGPMDQGGILQLSANSGHLNDPGI